MLMNICLYVCVYVYVCMCVCMIYIVCARMCACCPRIMMNLINIRGNKIIIKYVYKHYVITRVMFIENNKLIHSAESMVFLAVDHGKGNMFIRQKSAGIQTSC